jgi:Lrp/AsnC family transcriptional regulator for asnA, asnC and gidA
MDETDFEILQLLMKNPQERFSSIAKGVGVSPRTVQKKVQKMKEAGLILRSSIIMDLSKLGYEGEATIRITNAPGYDKATTIEALKGIPNIFIITEIIGDFDIMAIAAVKDYPSIVNMVNTIRQLPSVEKAEADFVTETQFPATTEFNRQLPSGKNTQSL